jgi:DNA-3-methyladenine glycosylase I
MIAYHDQEWGLPSHDDRHLFEMLILEGAQAGLSWETILKRREGYRAAFDGFDVKLVANYGAERKLELMQDTGIIRNRAKIESTVLNAQSFLRIQEEFGSFDAFLWGMFGGKPRVNSLKSMSDLPAKTEESDRLSKELLKRGFKFVGSTICYSYMQAIGVINDHLVTCPRFKEVQR